MYRHVSFLPLIILLTTTTPLHSTIIHVLGDSTTIKQGVQLSTLKKSIQRSTILYFMIMSMSGDRQPSLVVNQRSQTVYSLIIEEVCFILIMWEEHQRYWIVFF